MTEQVINLTDKDIEAVINLVDIVSSRGAFKGEELEAVGQLRNRYAAFLKYVIETNRKTESQEEQSEQELLTE